MTTRALIVTREAWLGTEFGDSYARRLFGDEVVEALPRNTRGKNVGRPKATLEWTKVERGGWVGEPGGHGHVEKRVGKTIAARLITRAWGGDVTAVHATKEIV